MKSVNHGFRRSVTDVLVSYPLASSPLRHSLGDFINWKEHRSFGAEFEEG
jgi:hypothetical protein